MTRFSIQFDKKIGEILLRQGAISAAQLTAALASQKNIKAKGGRHLKLGEILLFTKQLQLSELTKALSEQTNKARASREEVVQMQRRDQAIKSYLKNLKNKSSRKIKTSGFLDKLFFPRNS